MARALVVTDELLSLLAEGLEETGISLGRNIFSYMIQVRLWIKLKVLGVILIKSRPPMRPALAVHMLDVAMAMHIKKEDFSVVRSCRHLCSAPD